MTDSFGLGHELRNGGEIRRGYRARALLLWPRLDPARLARTRGDPLRIAALVAERTSQPLDVILAMVTRDLPAH
jgi:hypothetical protein